MLRSWSDSAFYCESKLLNSLLSLSRVLMLSKALLSCVVPEGPALPGCDIAVWPPPSAIDQRRPSGVEARTPGYIPRTHVLQQYVVLSSPWCRSVGGRTCTPARMPRPPDDHGAPPRNGLSKDLLLSTKGQSLVPSQRSSGLAERERLWRSQYLMEQENGRRGLRACPRKFTHFCHCRHTGQ